MEYSLKNLIVSIIIDDILIIRQNKNKILKKIKREFDAMFEIVDIRPISFYLGLKVNWN